MMGRRHAVLLVLVMVAAACGEPGPAGDVPAGASPEPSARAATTTADGEPESGTPPSTRVESTPPPTREESTTLAPGTGGEEEEDPAPASPETTGSGDHDEEGSEGTAPPASPGETEKEVPGAMGLEEMIARVVADVAGRAGVGESDVEVVSAESQTWNTSALGCPQKGYGYLQVVTPGYRIVLEAPDGTYDYRTDTEGNFVLCTGP